MTQPALHSLVDASGVLLDPEERQRFKERRLGVRRDLDVSPFLQLKTAAAPSAPPLDPLARRSHRRYRERPIPFAELSFFLQALRPVESGDGLRYRYASAGASYSVQVYMHVAPDRVEGVPPGVYYYHPPRHRLSVLAEDVHLAPEIHFPTNRAMAETAAFNLFLVCDPAAITPLYGARSRDFALLEAGLIAQLLETEGPRWGIGLCQIGWLEFDRLREACRLGGEQFLLHALIGGAIEDGGDEKRGAGDEGRTAGFKTSSMGLAQGAARTRASSPRTTPPGLDTGADPAVVARVEGELVAIWRQEMGVATVDVHQQFFDMGGTSLAAARIIRRLQETYGAAEIEVGDIFSYPTIHGLSTLLAARLSTRGVSGAVTGTEARADPSAPASPPNRAMLNAVRSYPGLPSKEPREVEESRDAQPILAPPGAVAVVAMAGRFPGAPDLETFWHNLEGGVSSVGPLPPERAGLVPEFEPRPTQQYRGSYLADIEHFDALFFRLSPKEARKTDPAQRLLLEICHELIEGAGRAGPGLAGHRTGLYVGAGSSEYWRTLVGHLDPQDLARVIPGNMPAVLANRISHFLDLHGPSLTVDTACSSSLVAVDMACRSLLSGDCDAAVVATVNLLLSPVTFEAYRQDGMEAGGGQCRSFDADADGFVRGEGLAAVLLKPLSDALAQGDPVLAVLRGSATNHDGSTNALAVPNPRTQAELIALAHERAGTTPESISYVEAHGTGTSLGDPIELSGLNQTFRAATQRRGFCGIGSLKTNLGHLEYAAGLSGLIKVVLALKHRRLPPSLHFECPNPHLDFASSPFYVVDRVREWQATGGVRRAAVSSFGVGGTNAHVIVEEAPPVGVRPRASAPPAAYLLPLSAHSGQALRRLAAAYLDYLGGPDPAPLGDLCFTASAGRGHHGYRLAVVCREADQLADRLHLFSLSGEDGEQRLRGSLIFAGAPRDSSGLSVPEQNWLEARIERLSPSAARDLEGWCQGSRFETWIRSRLARAQAESRDGQAEMVDVLAVVGQLYAWGCEIDWASVVGQGHRRVALPLYPFERQPLWVRVEGRSEGTERFSAPLRLADGGSSAVGESGPGLTLDAANPLLLDHRVGSTAVVPGAVFLDLMLAAVSASGAPSRWLREVRFIRPLVVPAQGSVELQSLWRTDAAGSEPVLSIEGRETGQVGEGFEVARAVVAARAVPSPPDLDLSRLVAQCPEPLEAAALYRGFERAGLRYGPTFRLLQTVVRGKGDVLGEIPVRDGGVTQPMLPPLVVEGALQCLACLALDRDQPPELYLPAGIDEVRIHHPVEGEVLAWGRRSPNEPSRGGELCGDVSLADGKGRVLVELLGVRARRASLAGGLRPQNPAPAASRQATVAEVRRHLAERIGRALEISAERVDPHRPLVEMGMDSLTALELMEELTLHTSEPLTPTFFFEHPTIHALAEGLVSEYRFRLAPLPATAGRERPVSPPTASKPTKRIPSPDERAISRPGSPAGTASRAAAVVGMAGRFPGALDPDELWQRLRRGDHLVRQVPVERWDIERYYDPDPAAPGKTYGRWGGFLEDADLFDPLLFRISDREAKWLDPQQRILLETVWQALERAGYGGRALKGRSVGVFVGASYNHVRDQAAFAGLTRDAGVSSDLAGPRIALDAHASLGNHNAILANRVSYFFDFHGPCLTVDTLCSSSLVALHLALGALRRGECDFALVAGVHVGMSPYYYEALSRLGALSPHGLCRTFDRRADGYVPGEGVGAVLLRPLPLALAERDHVHGVVLGTAVNHGGQAAGLTVPNPREQAAVVRSALADAEVEAQSLSYVEVHGTGTSLGDPLELSGLGRVFRDSDSRAQYCAVGSIKTNMGHLEPAAGIAGLIKVLLALEARELPPHLHFEEPNAQIEFAASPFYVLDHCRPWPLSQGVRRAGISSFGLGGTNAHAVVEEAPSPTPARVAGDDRDVFLLPLSARSEAVLRRLVDAYRHYLGASSVAPIADLCFTAGVGRAHFRHRLAILAADRAELATRLDRAATASVLGEARVEGLFAAPSGGLRALDEEARRSLEGAYSELSPAAAELFGSSVHGEVAEAIVPESAGTVEPPTAGAPALGADEWRHLLALVGRFYVLGAEVDWHALEIGCPRRRVVLPTYPFDHRRFGFELPDSGSVGAPQITTGQTGDDHHPLLGRRLRKGDGGSCFETEVDPRVTAGDGWASWLHQHRVRGVPTLPGAAILALALEAAEQVLQAPISRLRRVSFSRPLCLTNGEARQVRFSLDEVPEGSRVRLLSRPAGSAGEGGWNEHAAGIVGGDALAGKGRLDLAALRATCTESVDPQEAYRAFASWGLDYGSDFRVLHSLQRAEGEVLAELRGGEKAGPPAPGNGTMGLRLDPPLLDGALQSLGCLAVGRTQATGEVYLPYALDEVLLWGELRAPLWCHARIGAGSGMEELRGEARLADASGRVVAELRGLAFRRLPLPGRLAVPKEDRLLYAVRWQRQAPVAASDPVVEPARSGAWLVLGGHGEDGGLAQGLAARLRESGRRVIEVAAGSAGGTRRSVEGDGFELDPALPEDLRSLFESLEARGEELARVVHLPGVSTTPVGSLDALERALDRGVLSLFHLARELALRPAERMPQLVVVTANSHAIDGEAGCQQPEHGALWGLARALAHELPALAPQLVDLRIPAEDGEALADRLAAEVLQANPEREVVLRRDGRWVPSFAPLRASEAAPLEPLPLAGTYLISGGLGGLGLEAARWLAGRGPARLVLVGRSSLPHEDQAAAWLAEHPEEDPTSRRLRVLEELRGLGAQVLYSAADVAEPEAMVRILESARQRFGPIDVIFHAAGVLADGLVRSKSTERFLEVLRPKVLGAWNLDQLTTAEAPRMVLWSSVVSLYGNLGQSDYAAANRYLDCFASWRRGQGRPTVSIQWGPWGETGMAAGLASLARGRGVEPLSTQTALQALERALDLDRSHVAIVDLHRVGVMSQAAGSTRIVERPKAKATEWDLREAEDRLIERLATFLEIDSDNIDPETSFQDLGMDSIMAVQLLRELEEEVGLDVSPALLFELPNPRALARYLVEEVEPRPPTPGLDPSDEVAAAVPVVPGIKAGPPLVSPGSGPDSAGTGTEIAVIGYGCRFPGAATPEELWALLAGGVSAIREVPRERWSVEDYYHPDPRVSGKTSSRWGGFLEGIEEFDPELFRLSPFEVERMDPQQRLILEVAWQAIEMAGHAGGSLGGSRTGVFVGAGASQYAQRFAGRPHELSYQVAVGNSGSILANRVSYLFDLQGPSLTVDTACSSALVALHLAVQSLVAGESEMALAGGVNVLLGPDMFIALSQARMLSGSALPRPLDARADGYVRGEGAGVVLLKPLAAARADGDPVHAVIRGTAVNQDGRTAGLISPSGASEAEVVASALRRAGVRADSVSYVELQGTAHVLSDEVEVRALGQAFGETEKRRQACALGSIKPNLGHLELASGAAGLIKVILALAHQELPPTLGFEEPGAELHLEDTPFYLNDRLRPWNQGRGIRRAGISSFGFGGTNAHAILDEPPPLELVRNPVDRPLHLLCLSAHTSEALEELTRGYGDFLGSHPGESAADVCFTANTGRRHRRHRLAVAGANVSELRDRLVEAARGESSWAVCRGELRRPRQPRLAFVFTGQGSQYNGMARELFATHPTVRQTLEECDRILRGHLPLPLLEVLYGGSGAASCLDETRYTQPVLFALEVALARLLRSWGLRPVAALGHSVGELAAACDAGVFDLESGLKLVAERGRLLQSVGGGSMAAVLTDEETLRRAVEPVADRVSIAALNGPRHGVVSGEAEAVNELLEKFRSQGTAVRRLAVSHAFHSPLVEPILDDYGEVLEGVKFSSPSLRLVSGATGQLLAAGEIPGVDYWRRQLRRPVNFASALTNLVGSGCDALLEVGPQPSLIAMGRRALGESQPLWVASLRQGTGDWRSLLEGLATLYCRGQEIDWVAFDRDYRRRRVVLPGSPLRRRRLWIASRAAAPGDVATGAGGNGPGQALAARVAAGGSLDPGLAKLRPEELRSLVETTLREAVARQLDCEAEMVELGAPLSEMGLDSLMAIELAGEMTGRFGVALSLDEVAEGASISSLAELALAEERQGWTGARVTTEPSSPAPPVREARVRQQENLAPSGSTGLAPAVPSSPEAWGEFVRPAVKRRLGLVHLDRPYVRAQGDSLFYANDDGREIEVLDLVGGFGSTLLGHNSPELAIYAQELLGNQVPVHAQGAPRAAAGVLARELVERLGAVTNKRWMVTFTSTGAEAIEAAIQHAELEYGARGQAAARREDRSFAIQHHQRRHHGWELGEDVRQQVARALGEPPPADPLAVHRALQARNRRVLEAQPVFLALDRGFHGKTTGAVCLSANPGYRGADRQHGLQVLRADPEDGGALKDGLDGQIEELYRLQTSETGQWRLDVRPWCTVAGLFLEPVQGEGGVHPLTSEFLTSARDLADRHGFPLIVDEIQSGLGRCGAFTASERLGLIGDYYTFGKSLGGGLVKIAVLLIERRRYEGQFAVRHSSTFGEDELSCLVALKALEIYDRDRISARSKALGERLMAGLEVLAKRYPGSLAAVRGLGLMVGVELAAPATSASALLRLAGEDLGNIASGFLFHEAGIRILPTTSSPTTLRLEPSAYLGDADVERSLGALERLCQVLERANAGRLVSYMVTPSGSGKGGEVDDWRHLHPPAEHTEVRPHEPRVAFLTYFIDPGDAERWDPSLAELPAAAHESLIRSFHREVSPRLLGSYRVPAAGGDAVHLSLIGLMLTSRLIEEAMLGGDVGWLVERLEEAVDLARQRGCQVVGFGGLLSVVSHNCKKVAATDLCLTTGNALTVGMGVESIRSCCLESGVELGAACLGAVGALGNVCSTYVRIVAREVRRLVLVGRRRSLDRLELLAAELYEEAWAEIRQRPQEELQGLARALVGTRAVARLRAGASIAGGLGRWLHEQLGEELGLEAPIRLVQDPAALEACQIIVSATNSAEPILFPEHLGPGPVVVCDLAVPPDASPRVREERPDVVFTAGGAVRLPAGSQLELCRGQLPAGQLYACMAEALVLGLSGHRGHFSMGAIDPADVERIMALAHEHGYSLAESGAPVEESQTAGALDVAGEGEPDSPSTRAVEPQGAGKGATSQ